MQKAARGENLRCRIFQLSVLTTIFSSLLFFFGGGGEVEVYFQFTCLGFNPQTVSEWLGDECMSATGTIEGDDGPVEGAVV